MNHITALAIAKSINRDRLESVRQVRYDRPARAGRHAHRSPFGEMVRALTMGYRQEPRPSR
jgi:hypothetical protein